MTTKTQKFLGSISFTLVLVFSAATAAAHHSRANFDLDKVVEFDGTVVRFEWTNPHTAIVATVQTPDGKTVTKTVEGNAIATMIRRGFTKDSVKVGDRVHIVANPERAEGSQFYYLNSISVNGKPIGGAVGGNQPDPDKQVNSRVPGAGSQTLAATFRSGRSLDSVKRATQAHLVVNPANAGNRYSYVNSAPVSGVSGAPRGFVSVAGAQLSPADTTAMLRFVGVWRQGGFGGGRGGAGRGGGNNAGNANPGNANPGNARGGNAGGGGGGNARGGGGGGVLLARPMPSNLPVTEKGAASYAAFDYVDDPRNDCIPESLPAAISSTPYLFGIRQQGGDLVIEHENYAAARVIHMGQSAPPAGTKSDYDGYSVGRIEDGVLVIDTTLFSPQPWGNDTGLTSSEQKHIVERWTLAEDGQRLQVTYVQTDPVYLSKPVTRTLSWTPANDKLAYVWEVSTCSPEAGSRHLKEGHNPFEKKP